MPMRDGTLNCVAQQVVEHFEKAKRGHGLTSVRKQKIDAWKKECATWCSGARCGRTGKDSQATNNTA